LTVSKELEAIHGKLLNIAVIWTFGNTSSQSGLWIDETNWINETSIVDVEVSMVSRKDYKESGRQGEAFSWTRSAKPHGFIGSRKL